ncbi:MAG: UDP-N-acetylmuramoyl-L-alanine--D-glutamate ligase [Chlamydiales bacterium]|nr:UDP-N-acetylmuramoyl-L-alanine--D-glutamate ligase [Chlamydiales bacterium]
MKALIIGFGISGKGAAKLLLKQGYEVVAVDRNSEPFPGVQLLPETADIGPVDLTILSPGIPASHPQAKGREVIGEAELAMRFLTNRMIGITGTNGKTTLTLLMAHLLNVAGMEARALGNVGSSLAEYACHPNPEEILVVELSSFQLETMTTKGLDFGLITNIAPDHLDRYESFEAYQQTKYRLGTLLKSGELLTEDSYLQLTDDERYWEIRMNALYRAALALSLNLGITWETFREGLKSFQRPPHRMERVRTLNGVHFINDSKATNVAAVIYGLTQLEGPIHLIAGGRGKGESLEKWKTLFPGKVRQIYAIGEMAPQLEKEFEDVQRCENLEEAINKASASAKEGETVLLSPGGASFDQFRNYMQRGEMFKEIVNNLKEKQ